MTLLQGIVAILVALVGTAGGMFGFVQFMIKRKDEKEEKDFNKIIDERVEAKMNEFIRKCGEIGDVQIENAVEKARAEFKEGLDMRENTGRERFEINSEQIQQNTNMIQEVLEIQKQTNKKFDKLAESMTVLNEVTAINSKLAKACAEGVRSTNYDKMLVVAKKALKRGAITISEKTNLKQLYDSYLELQGSDSKITTYYEDCMKLKSIPDEEEDSRHN